MNKTVKKIKVSVNIPAYNEESFVEKSIESILSQDYDDFELLIIDDASRDNTAKIIKRYENHPKVRCYFRNRHKGIGFRRNELLGLSRGKYISPHDADDVMLPGKLKRQVKFLDENPGIGVVYGKALMMNKKGHVLKDRGFGSDCRKSWDLLRHVIPHCSAVIRKDKMQEIGGYTENTIADVDSDLFLKLAEVTKMHFINDFFYLYRVHKGNTYRFNKSRFKELKMIRNEAVKRRYKSRKVFSVRTNKENLILNNRFVSNFVDGRIIILNTEIGDYYNLNETASTIWLFLEKEKEIGEVIDLIAKRFNICSEKGQNDVYSFIGRLKKLKILM